MKRLKANFVYPDLRGILVEVCRGRNWRQLNFFICKMGATRGGHYHKKTRELFFVADGKCRITIINVKTKKKKRFIAEFKDVFIVDPYEAHFVYGIKDTRIVALLDTVHNIRKPDIHEYYD